MNQHATKLACQTCHIPEFARGGIPTKMNWDWSTAGKRDAEGKQITLKDAKGHITYESRKGDFVLDENVKPTYIWFNGQVNYTLKSDKLNLGVAITHINTLGGSPDDGKSLIWPIKRFGGKQPYDTVNMTLLTPHTAGNDDTGYWKNLEWNKALEAGVKVSGVPYSGKFDFVKTQMDWPITHMVAPKEKALTCVDCHARGGRLNGLPGIYVPASHPNGLLDKLGWGLALLVLLGVSGHGLLRVLSRGKTTGATK